MRVLIPALWVLLALFLQASALNQVLPVRLDLLIGFMVVWAAFTGPLSGALVGLGAGLALEILAGGGWVRPWVRFLIGGTIGALKPILYMRQSVLLPLVAIATAVEELLVAIAWLFVGSVTPFDLLPRTLAWTVPGNILLIWPLLTLVRMSYEFQRDRWTERSERLI